MNSNVIMQKLVLIAPLVARTVLYVLMGLSVLSIGVIIERWWFFRRRRDESTRNVGRRSQGAGARRSRGGAEAAGREPLGRGRDRRRGDRLVQPRAPTRSSRSSSRRRACGARSFEAGLLFLGTLGNNAPFIGLFGTVLGIVTAFRELGGNADGRRDGQRHGRHRRGADRDRGRHPGRAAGGHLLQRVPEEGRRHRGGRGRARQRRSSRR